MPSGKEGDLRVWGDHSQWITSEPVMVWKRIIMRLSTLAPAFSLSSEPFSIVLFSCLFGVLVYVATKGCFSVRFKRYRISRSSELSLDDETWEPGSSYPAATTERQEQALTRPEMAWRKYLEIQKGFAFLCICYLYCVFLNVRGTMWTKILRIKNNQACVKNSTGCLTD